MQINYCDPSMDLSFDESVIPYPDCRETDADFSQLFQYVISDFRLSINIQRNKYGYEDRQCLFSSIMGILQNLVLHNTT